MKSFRVAFFALTSLALLGTASARPLLVAPIRLSVPLGSNFTALYSNPAIDGDTIMVSAPHVTSNGTLQDAVHVFERASNGVWNYAGVLMDGAASNVFLEGNMAVVHGRDDIRVYERGAQGWTQTSTVDRAVIGDGYPIRVDNGAIIMHMYRPSSGTQCARADWVLRKVDGRWREVATVGAPDCGGAPASIVDVNDGRALIVTQPPDQAPQPPADVLVDTGAATWSRVATLPPPRWEGAPNGIGWFALGGSITNNWAYVESRNLYRNTGGNNWVPLGALAEPQRELNAQSYGGVLRGNTLVVRGLERDYELPYLDIYEVPTEWSTLLVYRPRANGIFDFYAKLSVDFDASRFAVSEDGRRVLVTATDNIEAEYATQLYVFEIPDEATFAGTQQDTFEAGNFSRWTPTAGQFEIATNGATRVLRQSSLAGDSGAYLSALDWQDQSIEADLRPLEFAENDRWFGLVVRRVDERNFYYVTFRSSGLFSLRRMRDGVVTKLADAGTRAFVPGRNYRVRLEAVGDQLAVFLDGIPRIHIKDQSFTHGHPGIAGYRTRFEADNVVVSPATRLLLRLDSDEREWSNPPADASGVWTDVYDPAANEFNRRQTDTSGDARWFSQVAIGNQVVSARMRPVSYGATTGTQDPWLGIAAHVVDAQNYYYVTLRRSNQFSLRKVVNGVVQVIATVPQTVTTGAWYDLRLEMVGTNIRAFVNGDLKIQTTDSTLSGGGRNAMLMYKTAADIDSYVAYQP